MKNNVYLVFPGASGPGHPAKTSLLPCKSSPLRVLAWEPGRFVV